MIISGVAHRAFATTATSHNRHNPTCLGSLFNRGGFKDIAAVLLDEDESWPPSSDWDHEQRHGAGGAAHGKVRLHPFLQGSVSLRSFLQDQLMPLPARSAYTLSYGLAYTSTIIHH